MNKRYLENVQAITEEVITPEDITRILREERERLTDPETGLSDIEATREAAANRLTEEVLRFYPIHYLKGDE
jgi:hypothetical protein